MKKRFTLEYWLNDGWYVGRLREIPGVFSQAECLPELEENIRDAYNLMLMGKAPTNIKIQTKTIEIITEDKPENKKKKMDNFFEAARKIEIDEEAIRKWREISKT